MALIRWNDSYSVKVAKLDAQHKIFFEMINELADAMRKGQGAATIQPTLAKLMEHLRTHIDDEEKLMWHTSYPELVAHQEEHRLYLFRVERYKNDLETTGNQDTVALLRILKDIILDHMLRVDAAYSVHLNAYGIH